MNSMQNNDLTIFSVFHKPYQQPTADFIKPIQVGAASSQHNLDMQKDNTGENISHKNSTYCELTALYWIWKNLEAIDSNFIGLAHYRRYFILPEKKVTMFGLKEKTNKADVYVKPLNTQTLNEIASLTLKEKLLNTLYDGKLILPTSVNLLGPKNYLFNIKENFMYNHLKEDWILLEETLKRTNPDYYIFFEKYREITHKISCYNMFIGSKEFVKNYCDWLFPILSELEKVVKLSGYAYQRRVFGFFAERLINVYVQKNQIPVAEFPVAFFE